MRVTDLNICEAKNLIEKDILSSYSKINQKC